MDKVIQKAAVQAMNDCIEHATDLFLDWRTSLWPDPETDPILLENRALGRRDWREMYTPAIYKRPSVFDDYDIDFGRIL